MEVAFVIGFVIGSWVGVVLMGTICARSRDEARIEGYNSGFKQGKAVARWIADLDLRTVEKYHEH